MPFFNEEDSVPVVWEEWTRELERSGLDYGLLLLDDGSTDRTLEILERYRWEHGAGRVEIFSRANRGHGQTCLEGYRQACGQRVSWVLQIDSDGQCDPSFFPAVWEQRYGHDVV